VKQASAPARARDRQAQPVLDRVQSARVAGPSLLDRDKAGGRSASAPAGPSFFQAALSPGIRNQKPERCPRDAVHAGSLADGARTGGIKLLADFMGKTAQLRIVEPVRQFQALVPAIGRDVGGLA